MSGWFHALDVMDNIVIFILFVVLPILAMAYVVNIVIEEEKSKEQQIRCELRKEAGKEFKIKTKKEKEGEKNEN